ncbi:hypothetical protein FYE47_03025 [Salmonella enterica]|nr:hypothetical protein [Salmonella enterica]ECW0264982.1 hypothetical protein [Salmonella enterica subsp. diarizonae]EEL1019032.1 hypothetical protein [Salmonella enterica]EEP9538105.1 hypothetical protein [Salmonella enterica]ELK1698040.1 hypothetical protein [Salmonella enterica]
MSSGIMNGYRYWPSLLNEETLDFIGPPRYCYTVMPDYGGAYLWGKKTRIMSGVGGNIASSRLNDYDDIYHEISPQLSKRFSLWQTEFERADMDEQGRLKTNWDIFHAEGMTLAVDLKYEVDNSATVFYTKPREDYDAEDRFDFYEIILLPDGKNRIVHHKYKKFPVDKKFVLKRGAGEFLYR